MDIGAIFLLFVLLVLVGLFVGRPFMLHPRQKTVRETQAVSTLLAEQDRLLIALQDLDFDNSLGKIPAEDYPVQRQALLQRAAATLKQLDELKDKDSTHPEDQVEQAIAKRRASKASAPSDDDLEDLISRRRGKLQGKAAGFCPNCGKAVMQADKFCPRCGNSLAAS
jgi:hypothetical protein